jgi:hypothetical protein
LKKSFIKQYLEIFFALQKMAFTNINSFLPAYPSVDKRGDNLFDLFPTGFYGSLYRKKEFNQLQPDLTKPRIIDGNFHAQPQQIYASRYSSYHTLYDNQIIIHSMGLGKTALAVLTVENNLENGFSGAVIAVPSGKFIRSFITEIINITGLKYYPDKYKELTSIELRRAIESRIKKVYTFLTFKAFGNSVERDKAIGNVTSKRLHNEYSNSVIIVDEAHNLRIQPDKKAETSQVNSAFHLLFHSVENCKILLMTATPMKDRWDEIADLANLILPLDKQLPSGDKFVQEFENDGLDIKNEDILKERLRGSISTLRTVPSTVKRDFIGEFIAGLKIFKVDVCQMSSHQASSYALALENDRKGIKKGVYSDSLQAINFVFPDGSYGPAGFKKFTIPVDKPAKALMKSGKKSRAARGTRSFDIPALTPELRQAIRVQGDSDEKALENLSVFSRKYAKTIETIIDQTKRKGGNTFIYNTFVDGSGLIIFARILELFGYSRSVRGIENSPGKRYVLLTNDTLDEGNIIADVQKTMNDPKNARGEYIQVVLGSRTAGEGLSFYNVENIGIHTPYWNYSPTDQAIGRGIRYRSHEEIEKIYAQEGKEFKVNIHHYVSVPPQDPEESIDVMMYKTSEDKDIRIKRGERFLKQISYDCGNSRLVNMKGVDGSRECEYLSCEYKCEGIDNFDIPPQDIDHSSFNNYYSEEEVEQIIQEVKKRYRTVFSLTLTELYKIFYQYEQFVVVKALKKIVDQSISIINQFGFKSYLREHNDVYFLMDSMEKPTSSLAAYYTSNPAIKSIIPFSEYANEVQLNKSGDFLDYIYKASQSGDFQEVLSYWNRLPFSVKEALLEVTIDAQESKAFHNQEFRNWLLELNKAVIFTLDNGTIVSTLNEGSIMCRNSEGKWRDCTDEEDIQSAVDAKKKETVVSLEDNPYGYYAVVNETLLRGKDGWKNGFWIRNVRKAKQVTGEDKRKNIRGEKCSIGTLTVGKLSTMAFEFGLDLPNDADKGRKIEDILKVLSSDSYIELKVKELSEPDVRRLFRLYKGKAKYICELLLKWFREKGLVEVMTKTSMRG